MRRDGPLKQARACLENRKAGRGGTSGRADDGPARGFRNGMGARKLPSEAERKEWGNGLLKRGKRRREHTSEAGRRKMRRDGPLKYGRGSRSLRTGEKRKGRGMPRRHGRGHPSAAGRESFRNVLFCLSFYGFSILRNRRMVGRKENEHEQSAQGPPMH